MTIFFVGRLSFLFGGRLFSLRVLVPTHSDVPSGELACQLRTSCSACAIMSARFDKGADCQMSPPPPSIGECPFTVSW